MPFYEIIFETGNKSVAFYENDEEMQSALGEHQRRAINGEPGSPAMELRSDIPTAETRIGTWVAERIKKVLQYEEHPTDYGENQLVDTGELTKAFEAAIKDSEMSGVVHVPTIAAAVRDTSSPLVTDAGPQDSQYKAPETAEVDLAFLEEVA